MTNKKYTLTNEEATSLGITLSPFRRYRLNDTLLNQLYTLRGNGGVVQACKNVGADVSTAPYMWLKTPKESVKVNNPYYVGKGEEKLDEGLIAKILSSKIIPSLTNKDVKKGKTLMLYLSDAHIGIQINNEAPLSNKMLSYKDSLDSLLKIIDQPFEEVVVIMCGDMIDSINNQTSRAGHHLPSMMTTREMFETFIDGSKSFFEQLNNHPYVGSIRFVSVGEDNHVGSVNGICSRALEIWLNAQYPEINTNVFFKTQEAIKVKEHTFIILHGKDASNQFKNHPLVLNPKTESFFTSWCLGNGITPNYKTTHIVKGDLHNSSYQLSRFFSYLNCLSMQTSSNWVQANFMANIPGVTYSIVSDNGVTNGEYFL